MRRGDVIVNLGGWSEVELEKIIHEASRIADAGLRISFLSGMFLGLVYRVSTLDSSSGPEEVLTLDLSGVDCFTFIDYIEAMRRSDSFDGFLGNLRKVRYRDGTVNYEKRNHFFTDWAEYGQTSVVDLTVQIGFGKSEGTEKILNLKKDGTLLLAGIEPRQRTINYIPPEHIDATVLQKLRTGDYAGIYSPTEGLDVSHVGIIIKREGNVVIFRHASSDRRYRKVVDQDFQNYISGKPGLVILRPRDHKG